MTVALFTGLPPASFTVTIRGFVNALPGLPTIADWLSLLLVLVIEAGSPAVLVREKLAGVPNAGDIFAVTLYGPPTIVLAVKAAEVATPFAPVIAVFAPAAKVPLATVWAGAVNVTVCPDTGFPWESVKVTTSGFVNAPLIGEDWPPPLVAAIEAAAPA